jgi:DNA invertase Pin-like site-specific DNA recombinase
MEIMKIRRLIDSGKAVYDLPLRVVYYARVSSEKDEQLNSLENQVAYFDEKIKANKNWIYCGGYIDEGLSGSSALKREQFLKMIEDGEGGLFDLVITKSISRFARDTLDSIQYTRLLLEKGVGVFFEQDNINTLDKDSELRLTIMASIAQEELRKLSENVRFGMKRAYKDGKVLGQDNIYGYDKKNGQLTVNEKEAEFVRELYELYATGKYGFRVMARMLTEQGYRNQSGGELNPGTFRAILTNPKYKGFYCGRKTESSDYRHQKKVKLAEDEHLVYKSENVPAIVSEELWERVNKIHEMRAEKFKKKGVNPVNRFSYSGKITCEEHDVRHYRKMWKDRSEHAEAWCCKEYVQKGRKACATPHIYTRDLDAIMEYIGNDLLSNKEKYVKSVDELIALYEKAGTSNADYTTQITKLTKEIEKAKAKQDKILDLYTEDKLSKERYLEQDGRLVAEVEKLSRKLDDLRKEQAQAKNQGASLGKVRDFFSTLIDSHGTALEVANEMLEDVMILKGSTTKEMKVRITMRYGSIIPCTLINFTQFIKYSKTEVSPIVGSERQSEELILYLLKEFEENPAKIWESNIFGKSLHSLVNEGLHNKLYRMPQDARMKLQETVQRIINDGCNGLICIIL